MRPPLRDLRAASCPRRRGGFTMAEMLVVMAIITILGAALLVALPKLRTRAMVRAAESDIHALSMALGEYHDHLGHYPSARFRTGTFADDVLRQALTNPNAGGAERGWGGARTDWSFIRKENVAKYADYGDDAKHNNDCKTKGIWQFCYGKHQILDPWGLPYFYIPAVDYVTLGVNVYAPHEANYATTQANVHGATKEPNDNGQPASRDSFYNPATHQLISNGPDQATDTEDAQPLVIDDGDRGTDSDDINDFGK